jgi:hypothetical protein
VRGRSRVGLQTVAISPCTLLTTAAALLLFYWPLIFFFLRFAASVLQACPGFHPFSREANRIAPDVCPPGLDWIVLGPPLFLSFCREV